MLLAAVLLGSLGAMAQSGNNEPLKGDVNEDGTIDVADITAVIKIMKDGGGTVAVGDYFYLGTTEPTAVNYKTLPGVVTSYTSIDEAIGATATVEAGETLYMLCPTTWMQGKNVIVEDKNGETIIFSDVKDEVTISGYTIYRTQIWNEASTITLKLPTPVATTGDCSNVTKNTATVSCTYENVPESGVCGVEYTWNDGSAKQSIGSSNGTQSITLSGLTPGTSYTYCAYIEANGQTYYGGNKSFTTELPDITGTWICTQKNSDGSEGDRWTITLNSNGKGQANNGSSTYNNVEWSIGTGGTVSICIVLYLYSTGLGGYCIQNFHGTVVDLNNPTRIEGTGAWNMGNSVVDRWNYTTFVMTRSQQ